MLPRSIVAPHPAKVVGIDRLDGTLCCNGHECGGRHVAVRCVEGPKSGVVVGRVKGEIAH